MTTNESVLGGDGGSGNAGAGDGGAGGAIGGGSGAGGQGAHGAGAGAGGAAGQVNSGGSDNPFLASLPEELRSEASLGLFKDVGGLAKSYLSVQKMVGAEKIAVPGQHATDEDWGNIFKKLGLPESVDKYEVEVPQTMKADDPILKAFKENAHKLGILPKQAAPLLKWYGETAAQLQKQAQETQIQKTVEGISGLKKEWGDAYDQEVKVAAAGLKALDPSGELGKQVKESGIGNNPTFIKLMNTFGKTLKEASMEGGGGGGAMTMSQLDSKIGALMNDSKGPYWDNKHPGHAAAVKEMENLRKAQTAAAQNSRSA